MRNGVRHLLGAGIGLLVTPLLAAGLAYGSEERFRFPAQITIDWGPMAMFLGSFVVIGLLATSRVSPLASLLPGLALTAFGGALLVRLSLGGDHMLWWDYVPREYMGAYQSLMGSYALPAGLVLLVASAFPARWRGKEAAPQEEPPPLEEERAPEPPPLPKRIPSRY